MLCRLVLDQTHAVYSQGYISRAEIGSVPLQSKIIN